MGFAVSRAMNWIGSRCSRTVSHGQRLGFSRWRTYELLKGIYSKTGFDDVAALTAWAVEHGLNETLGPETSAERPYPGMPKPRQKRIKLGRIRRSRLNPI
jgi:hypothetical protein